MQIRTQAISIESAGFNDVHNLTDRVASILHESRIAHGAVTVFVPGSTAGITTLEFERGAVEDLRRAMDRLVPPALHYDHDARWGDGNGFSHVRAALLGPSVTIPVVDGTLGLGTWQQIILVDFDNRPRRREVLVQCLGE